MLSAATERTSWRSESVVQDVSGCFLVFDASSGERLRSLNVSSSFKTRKTEVSIASRRFGFGEEEDR